ncbi:MAG TPA: hypothetical protein VGX76_24115 [Pirellulales bacterium]|jgi:hypothetical protein|nr:hypothetical protein [Pirellulales bacterium]
MPIKLSVGWSQKIGLPAYSSVGASCHIECELETALLFGERDEFEAQVEGVYSLCRQVVQDELVRHQAPLSHTPPHHHSAGNGQTADGQLPAGLASRGRSNGSNPAPFPYASDQGSSDSEQAAPAQETDLPAEAGDDLHTAAAEGATEDQGATERQLVFLQDMARQIRGLGVRRLETFAGERFGKPLQLLTTREASRLIEALKEVRAGKLGIQQLLEGGGA